MALGIVTIEKLHKLTNLLEKAFLRINNTLSLKDDLSETEVIILAKDEIKEEFIKLQEIFFDLIGLKVFKQVTSKYCGINNIEGQADEMI